MIAQLASFPVAGVTALVVAAATLVVEVRLLVTPHSSAASYDPTVPDARQVRAENVQRSRMSRLELGLGALGIGSALAGWAALTASRRGAANRFLAGTAGACCLAGWAVWLGLAAYCLGGPWVDDDRGPGLVITYDYY